MEKVFGTTERHDQFIRFGTKRAMVIFGFGEEDGQGYDYRHVFNHLPTEEEVKGVIIAQINAITDQKILAGFAWNGKPVWLSSENQFNFKAAYDIAVQTNGASLPVKFKLGEDADGEPVYHTFRSLSSFGEFYTSAVSYIQQCLTDGWEQKDAAAQWVKTLGLDSNLAEV